MSQKDNLIKSICRRLASGSDDTNVIIWDPFRCRLLKTIQTSHYGNIFSVKVRIIIRISRFM